MSGNTALKLVERNGVQKSRRVRHAIITGAVAAGAFVFMGAMAAWGSYFPERVAMRANESAALNKVMLESICRTSEDKVRVRTPSGTMDVKVGSDGGPLFREPIQVEGILVVIRALSQNTSSTGEKVAEFKAGDSTATKNLLPCPQ